MNDVTKQNGNAGVASSGEALNGERQEGAGATDPRTQALVPPVDIVEQDDCVRIIADLPGVNRDALSVEVDDGVLSLQGEVRISTPEGLSATYAELRGQRFTRRFSLSSEIDTDAIEAGIDRGVLTLTLPKKALHRPRRIEITPA
jgi:HSP20 family molecular chaperone IbpA